MYYTIGVNIIPFHSRTAALHSLFYELFMGTLSAWQNQVAAYLLQVYIFSSITKIHRFGIKSFCALITTFRQREKYAEKEQFFL